MRVLQFAHDNLSLSLYAKLGFRTRDLLACMGGAPAPREVPDYPTRRATPTDSDACNALRRHVHGRDRAGEGVTDDALAEGTVTVVEHDGRISGYATYAGFFAHALAESNDDLQALITSAGAVEHPGVLVPTTNADLFRWCLQARLRVVTLMTLMTL